MKRTITHVSLALVATVGIYGSVSSAALNDVGQLTVNADNLDICHATGDGRYRLINISVNAETAHRAHGDAAPGEGVPGDPSMRFDDACQQVAASVTFDPVADYDAGWLSGSNPNGAWSYGWSQTLVSSLTLYSQNYTTTQDCPTSTYRAWNDPTIDSGFTPSVIKNTGPTCAN